jgi:hypothetical protein
MKRVLIAGFLVGLLATPAAAGVGLHAGFSLDPDDFLFGVRFKSHPLAENFYLVPSVEVGFGDVTMVAGNLDVHYLFKTSSQYAPYAGAGITLNWFDFDNDSATEFGGSVLGGVQLNEKYFLEAKVGLGDVPDFKLVLGWNMP